MLQHPRDRLPIASLPNLTRLYTWGCPALPKTMQQTFSGRDAVAAVQTFLRQH